ncbi:glucose-1-phosphate thymidylyltransferase [Fulvivirga sp. RKSG066]|uniref:GlmU family protein n=1 Tax=Fulvivirga aurantia TaxID=2529383 RepID=UPI0012BC44FD|nr:GlmU family protein [Fulvivirga aurantia]MTI23013.1 glucose-1-phosphate thymidylyltransferase [Fulvivirga aurantia]
MNIILFDETKIRQSLLPLTFTRPVAEIRVGILTISEKWEYRLNGQVSFSTEKYLSEKYPLIEGEDNLFINGGLCPNDGLLIAIDTLSTGEALVSNDTILAAKSTKSNSEDLASLKQVAFDGDYTLIAEPWHIFKQNAAQIKEDFTQITKNRVSADLIDAHTVVYGKENLFIEEGASIRAAVIDAESGPVYIGKNAQVHPGAIIKGSFALCESSHVNMGAKIKGDSTIGPFSKVGGEVSNSVIFGYSNKGHDGFIGNSVIGEWCNLGADTNTSNLKNNYANVKIWDYSTGRFKDTGEMFCGLIMGDHSKCGINTMFNTGTVAGVSANIFGAGFPRNFIPSFAWGGSNGFTTYQLRKVKEVAEKVMERRQMVYDETEHNIMSEIFEQTAANRIWEKNK